MSLVHSGVDAWVAVVVPGTGVEAPPLDADELVEVTGALGEADELDEAAEVLVAGP